MGLALALGASTAASGSATGRITSNNADDYNPAISGSNVVQVMRNQRVPSLPTLARTPSTSGRSSPGPS